MPITLAQAGINALNDIDFNVIEDIRRNSWLMDQMVFDDTAVPGSNGGTLTYGYTRLIQAASAAPRAFNSEYTPGQATRLRYTVDLKPFGGAFNLDRALAQLGPAASNEITFQMQQLQISVPLRFQDEIINGDVTVDSRGFDGLSKLLVGASTEVNATNTDWTAATVNSQVLAQARLDELDYMLSQLVPSRMGSGDLQVPGSIPAGQKAILGNTRSLTRLRALARWSGIYTQSMDDAGRRIEEYGGWRLVDLADVADGSRQIIQINGSGVTSLYAVTFGLDGLHGVSMAGKPLVQTWMPDFNSAGAVKTGEIEMGPAGIVLKSTKAAGVLRGIKVR